MDSIDVEVPQLSDKEDCGVDHDQSSSWVIFLKKLYKGRAYYFAAIGSAVTDPEAIAVASANARPKETTYVGVTLLKNGHELSEYPVGWIRAAKNFPVDFWDTLYDKTTADRPWKSMYSNKVTSLMCSLCHRRTD